MRDGTSREVPHPDHRAQIIMQTHVQTGHFGLKRTKHMLQHRFYWNKMES